MNIFESVIQGIVQGLTEFLPVSSSGHLAITQHIIGFTEDNLFFNVMLHIGTLVAVCAFYYKLIFRLIREFFLLIADIFSGKFSWKKMSHDRRMLFMLFIGLLPLFLLFLPIPGTDMNIKDFADVISGNQKYFIVVGVSLIITSVLLFVGDVFNKKSVQKSTFKIKSDGRQDLTVSDAVIVGLTQCVAAVFPGLSRSGSTLAVGEIKGVNKQTALDYTFILAIPSILAAAVLEFKDALQAPQGVSVSWWCIVIGMIAAAIVGYLSIVLFKWLLKTDKMYVFIIYTALVGLATVVVGIIELASGKNIFV